MAIFFTQGTLNPASTTLAQDIRVAWTGAITAAIAAGKTTYSLVDNGYTTGGNVRSVITNSNGWALEMYHSSTLTSLPLTFIFGKTYTSATHTLNNVGFGYNVSFGVPQSYTSNSSGFSGVNTATTEPAVHGTKRFNAANTQTAWTAHIGENYAVFSVKITNTLGYYIYAGQFNSNVQNPALGYDFNSYGMFGSAGDILLQSFSNASVNALHGPVVDIDNFTDSGPANAASHDKYSATGKAKLSPFYIYRGSATPLNTNYTLGWLRGKISTNIAYHGYSNNATIGNTVAVDVKSYMYVGGEFWAAINGTDAYDGPVLPEPVITGGTETIDGGYKYHTFIESGTLTVPTGLTKTVEYLIVGGGGGGARGGGGGAGGLLNSSTTITSGIYTISVGAGGAGTVYPADTMGTTGQNSTALGLTAFGGGAGNRGNVYNSGNGGNGGSGGGPGSHDTGTNTGGTAVAGQGNAGGNRIHTGSPFPSAGGGGAGAAGGNTVSNSISGNGGIGLQVWGTYYAGGGGGANYITSGTNGSGGLGGGGFGGGAGAARNATANTGGGGGGAGFQTNASGGNGGSGIVIIRYAI